MVVLLAAMLMQPAGRDPLSERMAYLCGGKPACVAKQKDGVRRFLRIITVSRPPQKVVQNCLSGAARKKQTDWTKAANCLEKWVKRPPARRR